jgi:hypothetical protein
MGRRHYRQAGSADVGGNRIAARVSAAGGQKIRKKIIFRVQLRARIAIE